MADVLDERAVLRRLIAHLRGDAEALRLLALLLPHIAPALALHLPPDPTP